MFVWCTQNLCPDGTSFTWHQHTTSVDIKERIIKGYSHPFRITCNMSAVPLLKSTEKCYTKVITNNNYYSTCTQMSVDHQVLTHQIHCWFGDQSNAKVLWG